MGVLVSGKRVEQAGREGFEPPTGGYLRGLKSPLLCLAEPPAPLCGQSEVCAYKDCGVLSAFFTGSEGKIIEGKVIKITYSFSTGRL